MSEDGELRTDGANYRGIGKVIITIEAPAAGMKSTYTYSDAQIRQDRGIKFHSTSLVGPPDISPNGHERIIIKAWSGCKSWEEFEPRTDI
jgi:hypothetical protein